DALPILPVTYPRPVPIWRWYVAEATIWISGTVGRRLPSSIPETMLTAPVLDVDVRLERRSESLKVPESERSKLRLGATASSASRPRLRAFGTLKMTRDEHEPAVTVACRSRTSMLKTA